MTVEADLFNLLKTLVSNRAFPDFAPVNTARPYITYQQIGGEVVVFTEGAMADHDNARFQINVWGDTRASVKALSKQIETLLVGASVFQAQPESAAIADYDHDSLVYGSMQDFSIWSVR